jgi:hypothetical protein
VFAQRRSTTSEEKRETNANHQIDGPLTAHQYRTVFITIVGFPGPGGGQGPGGVSETPSSGCRYWGISASLAADPSRKMHAIINSALSKVVLEAFDRRRLLVGERQQQVTKPDCFDDHVEMT